MHERTDPEGLGSAVDAANRRFVEAIRTRDPGAAASGYAANARLLAPSADLIEGRAGIESFWRAGLDAGISAVDRVPIRIERHGSVAYEIGRYAICLRAPDGGEVVDRGTYVLVHEQTADGRWAWALETFTPEGSPQVASRAAGGTEREVGHGE